MADDDRRRILERRQRFLTAALVGATASVLVSACDETGAACHSARRNLPRGLTRAIGCTPKVCLSVERVDAAPPPAGPDAGDPGDGEAGR